MRNIKKFGLLGTGVIGGGWAARALHAGIDVIATDINHKMENWIQNAVEKASPSLEALTEGMNVPLKGQLTFTSDPIEMAKKSYFIQNIDPLIYGFVRMPKIYFVRRIVVSSSKLNSGIRPSYMNF